MNIDVPWKIPSGFDTMRNLLQTFSKPRCFETANMIMTFSMATKSPRNFQLYNSRTNTDKLFQSFNRILQMFKHMKTIDFFETIIYEWKMNKVTTNIHTFKVLVEIGLNINIQGRGKGDNRMSHPYI